MAEITINKAITKREYAQCVQIRTRVFVIGQGVPAEREIDEHENDCVYWLACIDGKPVGTVRWRKATDTLAKIERLAVLDEARGNGIGEKLTRAVINDIKLDLAINQIKLGAQDYIMPLYEKLGFKAIGDGYIDGGTIPHHDMIMDIKPALALRDAG